MYNTYNDTKKKIGLMGGTFNPIHIGHLIIGETAMQEFDLDEVIYIPVGDPPHKPRYEIAGAKHRYNMIAKAIAGNANFSLSSLEIKRKGKTYTIDTIEELYNIYGNEVDFFFIVGGDTLMELEGWKRATELFNRCSFIVYNRWGISNAALEKKARALREKYGAQILFAHGPLIDISSTYIRQNIKNTKSIKYLVPDDVIHYIEQNRIYV